MNSAADEDCVEPHSRSAEDVSLETVADGKDSVLRRISAMMERMAVNRFMGLAIPGHSAAKTLIKIGNRACTGFRNAPTDHQPIRV